MLPAGSMVRLGICATFITFDFRISFLFREWYGEDTDYKNAFHRHWAIYSPGHRPCQSPLFYRQAGAHSHDQAVSVSLPTWKACVGYEEGHEWILSKMKTGYPRYMYSQSRAIIGLRFRSFFVHKTIDAFAEAIVKKYGSFNERAFLFPSHSVAERCVDFFQHQEPLLDTGNVLRVVDLYPNPQYSVPSSDNIYVKPTVSAVIFPICYSKVAKTFWQHTGDGISSRRAEYCHKAFNDGQLITQKNLHEKEIGKCAMSPSKGPRRYRKKEVCGSSSYMAGSSERKDFVQFVEERFGRNLDVSLAANAKLAIRRRIAGALTENVDLSEALELSKPPMRKERVDGFSEHDVYLYSSGMSSIFNTHRTMMAYRGELKSISFGWVVLSRFDSR